MSNNQNGNITIGIDLGTTYCCVAAYINGKVIVISSDYGQNTTPSYLTIPGPEDEVEDEDDKNRDREDEDLSYIGQASKDSAVDYPQQTIYNVKRLIGRKFTDPCVQRDMKFWPFEVTKDPSGSLSPFIKVNDKLYTPEELSAKILFHLKRQAQEFLNCSEIKDVVITVPAYFNDGQRQATRDAGAIAGFNVLQIINEPTAAALAYNHHYRQNNDESQTKRNCLVFDLGGGTFDVSILTLENNTVTVLAVGGSTHLGGEDFDNAMVDYCLQEFKKEHNIDIHEIRKTLSKLTNAQEKANIEKKIIKSLRRLRNECECQKQYLSASADRVVITMDAFYDGHMLKVLFKQELFESLNKKYFTECMRIVEDVVKNSQLTKQDIDDIIMVGGSSRIPKIQKMLSELFGGKILINRVDKDLAVAHGAAIQAATASFIENNYIGDKTDEETTTNQQPPTVTITDVVPLSIGVEVDKILGGDNRNFDILIPKNTPIPHYISKEFATAADNVRSIRINIFEGESPFTQDNHHLGNFILTDLPRCPQGEPIVVTMGVDKEGILHVSAQLPKQKITNQISITEHKGRLTTEQIEELKNRMKKGKIIM